MLRFWPENKTKNKVTTGFQDPYYFIEHDFCHLFVWLNKLSFCKLHLQDSRYSIVNDNNKIISSWRPMNHSNERRIKGDEIFLFQSREHKIILLANKLLGKCIFEP